MAEIIAISAVSVFFVMLLGFIAWREVEHTKQVDVLTSKLMSRTYGEYASNKQVESKEQKEPKPKKSVNDPVLGVTY